MQNISVCKAMIIGCSSCEKVKVWGGGQGMGALILLEGPILCLFVHHFDNTWWHKRLKEEAIKVSMAMALMGGPFKKVIQI
jgi:hypothetical protein